MSTKKVGKYCRDLRRLKGVRQSEFADAINKSRQAVSWFEKGKGKFINHNMVAFYRFFFTN